ncbi:MAG TPA: hypothetical protein VE569_02845, partial [Acidimicrobiia bacterium]|nr:hypothetical protein [Acidimicrobiia bacterium]
METFDGGRLLTGLWEAVDTWDHNPSDQRRMRTCCKQMVGVLAGCSGETTQERWEDFEAGVWPDWLAGENRVGGNTWRWGSWAVVLSRAARPGWGYMATGRVGQWLTHLPTDDSLAVEAVRLAETVEDLSWVSSRGREVAVTLGVRVLLVGGHLRLEEITEEDLARIPAATKGQDAFEAALWRM